MKSKSKAPGRAEKTQILVVGGGPVGLCAALFAARRGLEVTLVEQNFRGYASGHATILHPSSLRLLAELGLSQQLLSAGSALSSVRLHAVDGSVLTIELPLPALTVPQTRLEEILLKALHRESVQLRSSCELTRLEPGADSVLATVERRQLVGLGSPANYNEWQPMSSSLVEAQFVIGADGYESFVRSALGADNVAAGPVETFAMFEGPASTSSSCLELSFDPEVTSVIYPLAQARARWGFQIASALDRQPDLEFLKALIAKHVLWLTAQPQSVDWSIVTHFERRVARRFGRERVWLAGDAAHVTHPFGGQSMNGGLNEAHDLVERMAECLFAKTSLATLEQWGAEREREWHKLLGMHAAIESKPGAPPWLADQAARIIPTLPASGRDLQHVLRELGLIVR